MNKKQLIVAWVIIVLMLSGCATVNFSANYYTPPPNYQAEVRILWDELMLRLPLRQVYSMSIISDKECKGLKGIPEIEKGHIKIPDNIIKYIFQNYYDHRFIILSCIIAHEISHTEYNLFDQSTPQVHFLVDQRAIELLNEGTSITPEDYYKSLYVLANYWYAYKGIAGHILNIGANLLSAASVAYGGPGVFGDWLAIDAEKRMDLLAKSYPIKERRCFVRSESPKIIPLGEGVDIKCLKPINAELRRKSQLAIENKIKLRKFGQEIKGKSKEEVEALLGKAFKETRQDWGTIVRQYNYEGRVIEVYFSEKDKAFSSNIPSINLMPNQDNWQELAFGKMMDTRIRVKPEIYGRVATGTDRNAPPGVLYWFKSKDGKKYYFSTDKEIAKLLLDETNK